MFTGFIVFVCFTKYIEEGNNWLNVVACNDDDKTSFGKGGRNASRKQLKVDKDAERDVETGQVPHTKREV